MPYKELREFMDFLMARGELETVEREVDRKYEIALVSQKSSEVNGPALLFENVKGYNIPVVTGIFGTKERCYLSLESTAKDWPKKFDKAIKNPIPCKIVKDGPCKEIIETGKEVNLNKFPILWQLEKDKGYYLTATNLIIKDPDTGKRNNSIHRMYVAGKDRLVPQIGAPMHLWPIMKKYWDRGKPAPVAVAVGVEPVTLEAAATKVPYDVDELELAGALRGEPVEMVKCETIDAEVPATSELVLEGEFPPGERAHEAPFAEFTGYYGEETYSPAFHVKAITHRKDMIYQGLIVGFPPDEGILMSCVEGEALAYSVVKKIVPEEDIRGINSPVSSVTFKVIVSFNKTVPGQGKLLLLALLGEFVQLKNAIVVDRDIDPFNPIEVDWAVTTRSRYEDIISVEALGNSLDPVAREECLSSKIGIDATLPLGGDKIGKLRVLRELGPSRYPTHKIDLKDYIAK